jgi:hypothetical protein
MACSMGGLCDRMAQLADISAGFVGEIACGTFLHCQPREPLALLICLGNEVSRDEALGSVFRRPLERSAFMKKTGRPEADVRRR